MSIDVLSQPNSAPIIVGDVADLAELRGVGRDTNGRFHLLLNSQLVQLAPEASSNFASVQHVLLVGLTGGEIAAARKVRMENITDGNELSVDQRIALAEALSLGQGPERKFYTEALAEFRRKNPELAAA